MAVRNDFAAGEVLAAADLNDTFAEKLPYSFGTATPSTTVEGFVWYDENDTPPTPKFWDGAAFQALTSGKILQVVRATDTTTRSTSSNTFVDANISVTITPQKSDSAILIIWSFRSDTNASGRALITTITDSSNNSISGAEQHGAFGDASRVIDAQTIIAYATPATTSATTYKGRFASGAGAGAVGLANATNTGQMYAIEVSA